MCESVRQKLGHTSVLVRFLEEIVDSKKAFRNYLTFWYVNLHIHFENDLIHLKHPNTSNNIKYINYKQKKQNFENK